MSLGSIAVLPKAAAKITRHNVLKHKTDLAFMHGKTAGAKKKSAAYNVCLFCGQFFVFHQGVRTKSEQEG